MIIFQIIFLGEKSKCFSLLFISWRYHYRDMLKILMLMYMYIWGCKVISCLLTTSKRTVIVEPIGIAN